MHAPRTFIQLIALLVFGVCLRIDAIGLGYIADDFLQIDLALNPPAQLNPALELYRFAPGDALASRASKVICS